MMFNDTSFMPVPFADLFVPAYQRRVSQTLIDKILERFDPRMVRPLLVCIESKNIIDGNHTRIALENKGYTHSIAQFISCKDLAEEMHVFNVANMTRKMLTPYDMHHAWLSVNDPIAVIVQEIVNFQCKGTGRVRDDKGNVISGTMPWVALRRLVIQYPESYHILLDRRVEGPRNSYSFRDLCIATVYEEHMSATSTSQE